MNKYFNKLYLEDSFNIYLLYFTCYKIILKKHILRLSLKSIILNKSFK